MTANATPLLTATPTDGINNVIVSHDDIFGSATGIYLGPRGIASVVKPNGNGSWEIIENMLLKK